MEIIYRNLNDIKLLDDNPRRISKEMMEKLKQSINNNRDYFEARPLILSDRTGELVVIAGNQRYKACVELGIDEVPTALLSGLTEEREREIIIRDNVNNGEWDEELLKDWDADELEDWGVSIDMEVDEEQNEAVEDDFSEEDEVKTRVKVGDMWQLGEHRIICGDSTNIEDVERLMNGERADLYLTDPPYNVSYEGKTKDALKIINDSMDDYVFRCFLVDAFTAVDNVLKKGAAFYIWHADSEGFNFRYAVKSCNWLLKQCLVWNKNSLVIGRQDYQCKHEPCLYGWKDGSSHHWYSDRKQTTVLDFNKPTKNGEHPTMKPVELFARLICNSSKEKDIVLDSFGGSGTTIVACEQLNRKARLMELDPHYCDVIIARWEKLTGKKAFKL